MQNSRSGVMSRLGSLNVSNRIPRIEFVSQGAKDRLNIHNGKPYSRPVTATRGPGTSATAVHQKRRRTRRAAKFAEVGLIESKLPPKTFGTMFGGLTLIPTISTIDPPPRTCFNCWQPGHAKKNCPRPVVTRSCNNCGRRGEDVTTCPRCSEAHQKYSAYMKGEVLDRAELDQLFPQGHAFVKNGIEVTYNEDKAYNDGCDDALQHVIDQEDRDCQMSHYYDERDTEVPYVVPKVKYVETREYVKNPVSRRNHEYEEDYQARRRHDDYDYEERERSYDERDREEYPLYRDRESSEDRSVERYRPANSSVVDADSDPVQEVLQLARSIAHLSPETQELIMKQVMAERKEKAKLRALQHRVDEDWP